MFEKAGVAGWKVLIPFYNAWVWLKITERPMWWFIFIFIPFINVFMVLLMIVEIVKCFNKYSLWEQGLAVIFPFVYLPYLGLSKTEVFLNQSQRGPVAKTKIREWVDAIIFAVIAATIIRTFLIEAYTIPTSSMEKSLLIGDFLFVSKISYGPKVPNTPIAFPFVHHTMPKTQNVKSYVEWIKLPYYRFPGYTKVKRFDAVVFNYPDGDTVALNQQNASYYSLVRHFGWERVNHDNYNFGNVVARPVDKRENYIKRCIGLPGDTLQIIDQEIFVDGKQIENPINRQYRYIVKTNNRILNPKILDDLKINRDASERMRIEGGYLLTLTEESAKKLSKLKDIVEITRFVNKKGEWNPDVLPYDTMEVVWNEDNFGPIYIPKAGTTIELSPLNLKIYERAIVVYEGNNLKVTDGKIYINGNETTSYTFKMDYYWMMGDNRHNSADSRFWGFVPIDHIVGKAVFVWLSLEKDKSLIEGKIRWNKMFRLVK